VKTYRLWLLVLAYMLYWGMATYMVLAHQVVFVEDAGYDSMYAASAFGLFGLFMAVGQLLGFLSDRMGREPAFTLATILCILGLVILLSIQHTSRPWILYFYSVCFGLGAGFVVPALTAGTADIFHGRHFGAIHGMLLLGMGIGGGVGPWLGGFLFDLWGSYTFAFIVCMVAYAFACIAFWIAAPRKGNR
jgi:MFS family permease